MTHPIGPIGDSPFNKGFLLVAGLSPCSNIWNLSLGFHVLTSCLEQVLVRYGGVQMPR